MVARPDDDGEMVTSRLPYVGGVPLVTVHEADLPEMERAAQLVADENGIPVHVVYFERVEVTKILHPRKRSRFDRLRAVVAGWF